MSKYERIAIVLLGLSTIANGVTAVELARLARNGFDVELSDEEAEKIITAHEIAVEDMSDDDEEQGL